MVSHLISIQDVAKMDLLQLALDGANKYIEEENELHGKQEGMR